jgi:hypothetical protein
MLTRWLRRVRRVFASECRPRWTSHSTAPNCHLQAARQIARASAVVCCRTGTGSTHSGGSRCSKPARIVPKLEKWREKAFLNKVTFLCGSSGRRRTSRRTERAGQPRSRRATTRAGLVRLMPTEIVGRVAAVGGRVNTWAHRRSARRKTCRPRCAARAPARPWVLRSSRLQARHLRGCAALQAREKGGGHKPVESLITICGAHHRALHRGSPTR